MSAFLYVPVLLIHTVLKKDNSQLGAVCLLVLFTPLFACYGLNGNMFASLSARVPLRSEFLKSRNERVNEDGPCVLNQPHEVFPLSAIITSCAVFIHFSIQVS